MLELLVLKKYAECISQRRKWTSGARVMIFVFMFPAGGNFCKKYCFCYFKRVRNTENRRYLDGFEPQECARTLSFEKICSRMH